MEADLKHRGRSIAQCQTRTPGRLLRFQNRAGFVEAVKSVGQLKQIVRQNVRPEIVEDLRDDFGKLAELFRQTDFRGVL